jgi:RNA binding exosome subunit
MALADDVRLSSAEINVLVHATENENKILHSIDNVLSISAEKFSYSVSEGHWGNRILLLTATIDGQSAKDLILKIMSSLNSNDKYLLSSLFDKYVDENGNLYIRLDKQWICKGKISLSESDSIRVRFRPVRRYKPSNTLQNYRGLLP